MDLGLGVRVKILTLNNGQWSGRPDPWFNNGCTPAQAP